MLKPQLPNIGDWQQKLFYVVILLIFYQMSIYTINSLGCSYRTLVRNEPILTDKICQTTSEDTKSAVEKYLTLVLALISKVPDGNQSGSKTTRKRKAPPVKSTITPRGPQE